MEKLAAGVCLHCLRPMAKLIGRGCCGRFSSSNGFCRRLSKKFMRCFAQWTPSNAAFLLSATTTTTTTTSSSRLDCRFRGISMSLDDHRTPLLSSVALKSRYGFIAIIPHNSSCQKYRHNVSQLINNFGYKSLLWTRLCAFIHKDSHSFDTIYQSVSPLASVPNRLASTAIGNKCHFSHINAQQTRYKSTLTKFSTMNNILHRNSVSLAKSSSPDASCHYETFDQADYKTAIQLLNQLQTNAENIQQAIEKERSSNMSKSLEKTRYFLSLIGIEPEELNRLNAVHVAGTKGKGSTCAFVESIMRNNGFKTGFYSSPHLVVARERIRINGEPISEQMFTDYFNLVYGAIWRNKSPDVSMPAYFNFMTIMAFQLFLREKVDVAIMEVGIGGEYDCTNVIPKPVVTGVTSLDLDHCKLLGDRIEQIAWQKSGIFKPKVAAFTVKQNEKAMQVLRERAIEKDATLFVAPSWSLYPQCYSTHLGINGEVQKVNASLAIQLAHYWLSKYHHADHHIVSTLLTNEGQFADVVSLGVNNYGKALTQTKWFGRCEIIRRDHQVTYFLDAAHTVDSMQNCCDWFVEESHVGSNDGGDHDRSLFNLNQSKSGRQTEEGCTIVPEQPFRVLVFNCTGERNPLPLLSKLTDIGFDLVLFTTNEISGQKEASSDVANFTVTLKREKEICTKNLLTWSDKLGMKNETVKVFCITEAIQTIEAKAKKLRPRPVHVLVTGSVHLVGGFIGLIHPYFLCESAKSKL